VIVCSTLATKALK